MKHRLLPVLLLASMVSIPALAAGNPELPPELQKLNISAGRWVYHGKTLNTPFGKAGSWTWNEDCRWSENGVFLACGFTNDWSGKMIKSLVVDTYNEKDRSYWHYELFAGGDSGARPFISKMTVNGNTRIEYAETVNHGKKTRTRITYVFDSPAHVRVKIEISHRGAHWVTVDDGEGVKQPGL